MIKYDDCHIHIKRVKDLNKKKLVQTCLYLTLFGLLSIIPISKASASTAWNLQVNGANTTVNYNYDQLLAMPETDVNANLACYGSPVASGNWGGVSLSYLLSQTGLDPTTASVNFAAKDGYKVSLSFEVAMQSDVIIAYQLNGASLPETLRLVLPGYNGNMWISMITSITMSASTAQPGNEGTLPSTWQYWNSPPIKAPDIWPKNETNIEPTVSPIVPTAMPSTIPPTIPPTNVTQPTQKASVQQESNSKGINFPVEAVYGTALGTTVALVVATIALTKRRNIRESTSSSRPVS
jgi:hypothetical protein